jgi:uncharacterized protein (DUF1330 family)
MRYLVTGLSGLDKIVLDPRCIVAQGDAMVFEGPWPWAAPVVALIDDTTIASVRASGIDGYLVDQLGEPGAGEAFVVAAHRMRDLGAFQPYAEQVGAVVERFGGRFLARSAKAEMLSGDFVSDRAVILEFPRAADAVGFYVSDVYAPLMKIRHAASDPRFLVRARSGPLPAEARAAAERYLRGHAASAH